jgi:hypothetical protein
MTAPDPQTPRCAGCGAPGHVSTICWNKRQSPPGAALKLAWLGGKPVLMCTTCRAKLEKYKRRRHG